MSEKNSFIHGFIKKNRPQFRKYSEYLKKNDWSTASIDNNLDDAFFVDYYSEDPTKAKKAEVLKMFKELIATQKNNVKAKSDEFALQNNMMSDILERIKYFAKKTEGEHNKKEFKDFIKECFKIIDTHTDRTDDYVNSFDISKIANQEVRTEEMAFIRTCFAGLTKIQDKITELNIKEDSDQTAGIEFLNGMKAPLSMHKILSEIYPEINKKLDEIGIDFEADPGNEMLMYMDNVPQWNDEKHYWEQDKKTLQFYVNEFSKLENGINIDSVYISGWAYYHMNVFVTPIPHKIWNDIKKEYVSKDKIINPPLRDSDWMLFENRSLQESNKYLFMFVAATRRAAKTTSEASMLGHAATIGKFELLCSGASGKDLGQLAKNFKIDSLHKNSAFRVHNVTNDWEKKIEMGIKTKSNKTIPFSTLHIINTDSGNNKEIYSGYTPDLVVGDEIMKSIFLEALEGLLPALRGADGLIRCFGMLSGTAGTDALSADGIKVLSNPDLHDTLPMQWDILERGVPEHLRTWQEDRLKPFGTFIPGQCRVDMPKIESTLADYLGIGNSEYLKKIKIKVTDWEKAGKLIEERRDKVAGDKIKLLKEVLYSPLTPSEIKMSGKQNRFPVAEAKAHREYLLQTGKWDRRRELFRDSQGNIRAEISTKPLAEFPHRGGLVDAPFLIFEDIPKERPKYGTYTAGFDDYASEESDTDSVSTFYVMKNEILGDPFSNKIVASLSFRPEKHSEVWEKWLLLMEAYNLDQTCFGENFNYGIKDFLEKKHLADKYLAPSLDFSASFNIPNNGKRKTGWNPSTSKRFLFDLFIEYCNEEFEEEQEDGTVKILKGVQRIDDIVLLEECIQWAENLNVDRITSAQAAFSYGFFLRSSHRWKVMNYKVDNPHQEEKPKEKEPRKPQFYSNRTRGGFYRKKR